MRSKAKIKEIARIYAAHVVDSSTGSGASSDLFSDAEHELFVEEVHKIALKMIPDDLNLGSLTNIILYADNKYSKP